MMDFRGLLGGFGGTWKLIVGSRSDHRVADSLEMDLEEEVSLY